VLLACALVSVTLDVRSGDSALVGAARDATAGVLGPVQRAVHTVVSPVGSVLGSLPELRTAREDASRLERSNAELRAALRDAALDTARADELRRLGLLAGRGQYRIVSAEVIALAPALGFEWTLTVDAGARDGLRPGMTVLNADGLVGRVKSVGPYTAVVLLAIDPVSTVGSRVESSGQLGTATGNGLAELDLRLFDPQAAIRRGDRLITGPFGASTYAAGIPVGTVTSVAPAGAGLVRTARVRPAVRFGAVDVVGIVVAGPRVDPRTAVLPPRPAPTSPAKAAPAQPAPARAAG